MSKHKRKPTKCDCGKLFTARHGETICPECSDALEHDTNVEMFGDDADYLEYAGLADKIGNK